jgi:hypothetical protein
MKLVEIRVHAGGSGYGSAPTVVILEPGESKGVGGQASATVSGGKLISIAVTAHGSNYAHVPTVQLVGGGGSGADAYALLG